MPAKLYDPPELIQSIKEQYENNPHLGLRKIAKLLGIKRERVKRILKELGIFIENKKKLRIVYLKTEQTCKNCKIIKPIDQFRKRYNEKTNRISFETICSDCTKQYAKRKNRERYQKNKEKYKEQGKNPKIKAKRAIQNREYRRKNKAILYKKAKARMKIKLQNDPSLKLRGFVSNTISEMLKKNGSSKNGQSVMKYLPYTIQELKKHLEKQFEPWMNWQNRGKYIRSQWNDNDQSTWKWNIDHIIPQSDLLYSSMKDENFKKCWDLNNLRPYSAKQNVIDGVSKVRHKCQEKE